MIRKIAIAMLSTFAFAEERNLEERLDGLRELWVGKFKEFGKSEAQIADFERYFAQQSSRVLEDNDMNEHHIFPGVDANLVIESDLDIILDFIDEELGPRTL